MKTVAIVLSVIGVLVLAVCGGLFFFGRSLFQSAVATDAEGKKFATEVARAVGTNWDSEVLHARGSKRYQQSAPKDKIAEVLALCKERLGPLKSIGEFTTTSINTNTDAATGSRTTLAINAPAQFEKGSGRLEITVAKEGDKWGVDLFSVRSDLLTAAPAAKPSSPSQPAPTTPTNPATPSDDDSESETGDTGGTSDDY